MRETRQTRIENHAYLDAPVSASHFTVPAAGDLDSARQARPFVPGEGNDRAMAEERRAAALVRPDRVHASR